MSDSPSKFDREFLRAALSLGGKSEVDRLLYASDVALAPEDLRGRTVKKKLVYAVTSDNLAEPLRAAKLRAVVIPDYDYTRIERMKVALVAAAAAGFVEPGHLVLCATSDAHQRLPDTLLRIRVGAAPRGPPRAGDRNDSLDLGAAGLGGDFPRQVIEAALNLALRIGHDGIEGYPVGTIFVVGDSTAVMEKSRQLILNPFQGVSESERNILDPRCRDAIRNFAMLDGAFVVREDGVVLTAGRYLQTSNQELPIPQGLGTRHVAACSISAETDAVALAVSQTSGTVRVFRKGNIVLELAQSARRS